LFVADEIVFLGLLVYFNSLKAAFVENEKVSLIHLTAGPAQRRIGFNRNYIIK